MNKQADVIVYAVSMILKAAILAASWAGKVRKKGLETIANMPSGQKSKIAAKSRMIRAYKKI